MSDDDRLWELVRGIEERLPLRRERLEAFFATTFATSRDHNRRPILVGKSARYELELRPANGSVDGDLTVRFTPALNVDASAVVARFADGSSLPPPPPGYGPAEAAGAYVANRPWGQIWFTFFTGNRLTQISIGPGMRYSPGV